MLISSSPVMASNMAQNEAVFGRGSGGSVFQVIGHFEKSSVWKAITQNATRGRAAFPPRANRSRWPAAQVSGRLGAQ